LTIPQSEWDFSSVSTSELEACIYYEYARESSTLRGLAGKYFALKKEHDREVDGEFQSQFSESLGPGAKPNEVAPEWNKVLKERAGFLDNFMWGWPEYLQLGAAMSGKDRPKNPLDDWRLALLVFAKLKSGQIVLGLPDFPDKPWTATHESLRKAAMAAVVTPKLVVHCPWRAGAWPTSGREFDSSGERLILRIGWGDGTTEQIVREFRKWATEYRKKYCKHMPPPRGQRLTVTKAWLKRLAEMRLWKTGSGFVGGQRIQDEALAAEERNREQGIRFAPRDKQLKEPISANASEKKVRADIARVTTDLRKLFEGLVPRDEIPLSYPFRTRFAVPPETP
jgi:hypothetical protein